MRPSSAGGSELTGLTPGRSRKSPFSATPGREIAIFRRKGMEASWNTSFTHFGVRIRGRNEVRPESPDQPVIQTEESSAESTLNSSGNSGFHPLSDGFRNPARRDRKRPGHGRVSGSLARTIHTVSTIRSRAGRPGKFLQACSRISPPIQEEWDSRTPSSQARISNPAPRAASLTSLSDLGDGGISLCKKVCARHTSWGRTRATYSNSSSLVSRTCPTENRGQKAMAPLG